MKLGPDLDLVARVSHDADGGRVRSPVGGDGPTEETAGESRRGNPRTSAALPHQIRRSSLKPGW